jgi:SapC protein
MTRHALLSNVTHKDMRIITERSARYGDDVMAAVTFPAEFRNIQAFYPIVFAKTDEGAYNPLALLGFKAKQNLFLGKDGGWDANYVPLLIERQPFLIGPNDADGPKIHIDLDSPRVSQSEGELLFKEQGGTSEYLNHIGSVLNAIHLGMQASQPFIAALNEHNLLEPFALDIKFKDGAERRFAGFFTVNEEKLAKLDGAALGKLHEKGYLQAAFMIIASLSNFRDLIERASKLEAAER